MNWLNYNIMLIGFMGTGKTTISKQLSRRMNIEEVDLDKYIVESQSKSINQIFEESGEEGFRTIESSCLKEVQVNKGKIVSCGGGTVLREENVKCMKDGGVIVLLTATPETVYNRVKDNNDRPILNGNMNVEYIEQLMAKRRDIYEAVADIKIVTDGKTPANICNEIIEQLDKKVKNG